MFLKNRDPCHHFSFKMFISSRLFFQPKKYIYVRKEDLPSPMTIGEVKGLYSTEGTMITIVYASFSLKMKPMFQHKLCLQPLRARYNDCWKMHYRNANVYPWPNNWVMFIARSKKPTASENAGDQKAEAYCGMFITAYVVFQRLCVKAHMSKHSHAASHLSDVSQKSSKCVDKKIYGTKNNWSCPFCFLNICQDALLFAKHDRLVSSAKFFSQNILPCARGCSGDKCGKREEKVQNLR